ncbi:hypothetical protein LTR61_010887 [Exophiala xenobiotica]|nr:hypothetical protein LTR61_010887 [Exophiala xenobiotica]
MRTSSISMEGPSSCTPTGRISKAKKGKRVHACEFPGCGKRYFPALVLGAGKLSIVLTFSSGIKRDSNDLENSVGSPSGHMNRTPQMSVISEPPPSSVMPSAVMSSPHADRSAPRSSAGGLSIGSLVHPQTDYRYSMGTPAFNGFTRQPMHFVPGFSASDDSMFYTPESSQSPVSEYYGRYPHRQSISSSSSVAAFEPNRASPLISGTIPGPWAPSSAPPSILPSNMLDDGAYLPVSPPFLWIGAYTEADQSPADSSLPIPLSDLDGYEWSVIRGELSHSSGLLSGDVTTGVSGTIRWHCLDHYWQYFDPHFPIVHRPTFLPTKPSPLLASAMAAIGSQYDDRPDAKQYSLTLLDIATKLLRRRDSITSRSRLADLQTVFLLEVLSKYCSRRVEVEMSSRFRSLFASLDQARRTLSTDPLAVFRTLRKEKTPEDVARAHKFWLDHETRRRILQASTLLDHQQMTLFEQPPTIVQHERPRRTTGPSLRCTIPLPCSEELWETSPVEAWVQVATNTDAYKPRASRLEQASATTMDYFQSQVALAAAQGSPDHGSPPQTDQGGSVDTSACLTFNRHVVEMARNTPIRQLLVTSGESWILGRKLENEAEYQEAKRNLRAWANSNLESRVAFWHATQLIRSRVQFIYSEPTKTDLVVTFQSTHMLQEPWALYLAALICWAYGFSASMTMLESSSSTISEPHSIQSRNSNSNSNSNSSLSLGSGSGLSSAHPALLDSHEAAYSMREFLKATDVESPEDMLRVDPQVFGRMHGLLEVIRVNKIGPLLGGLMNEAERVLYRLVEGRSRLSHF